MNQALERALIDSLDCLVELVQEGTPPEEARKRVRLLHADHSDMKMELIWEEQTYDRSVHYDMLLHPPTRGTVSLSFCPDRGLPWPLRGVHRHSARDLLRVNKTVLQVAQAIACLDFMWEDARAMKRLVNVCLLQEALEEDPLELTDRELQLAMDRFRRARKLYRARDTFRWLEERGMTHEQLEQRVRDEAIVAKLRDKVTAGRVEDYFESHQADFDTAAVARIVVTDEGSARRAYEEVCRGTMAFYEAAQHCFLTEIGSSATPSLEVFTVLKRCELLPEVASVVFAAAPGDLVGPLCSGHTYTILRILSVVPGQLDARTRSEIQKILFENWLKGRREAAVIEWLWGNATQTSLEAAP
jgi:putative peptide maturation system protein